MDNSLPPPLIVHSVRIPAGAEIVSDPDEEVFLLYSELQRTKSSPTSTDATSSTTTRLDQQHRGLGHVDSRRNVLSVVIELKGGGQQQQQQHLPIDEIEREDKSKKRLRNRERKKRIRYIEDKTIEIDLVQDVTALRSRKGDTGSVVWHASVDFARFVLQHAHLHSPECLFDLEMLKHQHILELGAGTGLLSLLLSPLCHRYTVTDIEALVPLIQKNIEMNTRKGTTLSSNIQVLPLDWVVLKDTPPNRRHLLLPYPFQKQQQEAEEEGKDTISTPIDILLIVDCIYHPSLLPPLIETINYLTRPNKSTVVVVVAELRSEHVVREFLELWINNSGNQSWKIYRCPLGMIVGPYVVWIGWKEEGRY